MHVSQNTQLRLIISLLNLEISDSIGNYREKVILIINQLDAQNLVL